MKWFLKCMRNYANFRGRARRMEYWTFVLISMVCVYAVWASGMALSGDFALFDSFSAAYADHADAVLRRTLEIWKLQLTRYWYCSAVGLVFLLPGMAVAVRRLHDTGRSGWLLGFFWLVYVVIIALAVGCLGLVQSPRGAMVWLFYGFGMYLRGLVFLFAFVVWLCLPGDKGPNRYGPDPKAAVEA